MAGPLVCDLCDEPDDPVIFLVTRTDNGDTITLGAGCMPAWATAVVDSLSSDDTAPPAETAPETPEAPGGEVAGDTEPAPPKSGRRSRQAPAEATTATAEGPEAAAG